MIMKKSFYVPLGILLFSLLLGLINKWNWQALQKPLPQNNLESIDTGTTNQNNYKEFVTVDKNFRINYPAAWFRLENENILAALNSKEWGEKYALKTIFVAQNLQQGKFAQLIVQEGVFDINVKEILQKMKKSNQEQQLKMEIVKSDIEGDRGVFEIRYLTPNAPVLFSKEMILLGGKKGYLIAFSALENDWLEFSQQADAILGSIEVSP